MTLAEILAEFKRIYQERHARARELSRNGARVWGYTSSAVPLEVLEAAGLYPVQLTIDGRARFSEAGKRLNPYYYCLIAHDWLGQIQEGVYDYLEGLVHADICSPGRSIIEAVNYLELIPSSFALSFPTENNATTRRFFKAELKELIHFLEGLTGRKVGDEDLWRGIHRQRRKRELLRRLARLREERATALTGSQACRVVLAGLVAGTDRFNSLLAELLAAPERPGRAPEEGVRIMVSSLLVEEAAGLIKMIEEMGGLVCMDDFHLGPRCFSGEELQGWESDPLEQLAAEYLGRVPAPYRVTQEYRNEMLAGQAMRARARGFVTLLPRYCQPAILQYPALERRLKSLGLRTLRLEDGMSAEATRTRLAALVESCR